MPIATTSDALAQLRNHGYVNLVTFRKNGRGVATPVWFALSREGTRLYAFTSSNTGKVKRIRNNPTVEIALATFSGKPLGPAMKARARILAGEESVEALHELTRKYGILLRIFTLLNRLRPTKRVYLEIVPDK